MDPLSCGNPVYEDVKAESSHEGFNIRENSCYGKVTSTANKIDYDRKNHSNNQVIIMLFVIVILFALLLGIAGACVAFAVQIATLKSEIASLQMQLSRQNASIGSTYQQLNKKVSRQLNTSIDLLYQQLSQQNQQLTQLDIRTQQLNTSTRLLEQISAFYPTTLTSCAALPPSSPSGDYWVRASNGSAMSVYCDHDQVVWWSHWRVDASG